MMFNLKRFPIMLLRRRFQSNMLAWLFVVLAGFVFVPSTRAADLTAANTAELVTAITSINTGGGGAHSITITADITLTEVLPALNNSSASLITINGGGFSLTGDGASTILRVTPSTPVRLQNIKLVNGKGSSGPNSTGGGAIYNEGNLTLIEVFVSNNTATLGGGILTYATSGRSAGLTLIRSEVNDNQAEQGGGIALVASSGNATATFRESSVYDNTGQLYGGGLFNLSQGANARAIVQLVQTAFFNNTTQGDGGGILSNAASGGVAQVFLDRSSLYQNTAGDNGAGISSTNDGGDISVSLTNSTLSTNQASDTGGGVYLADTSENGDLTLNYSTVANNSAATGGGLAITSGTTSKTMVFLGTSIISGNTGGNCLAQAGAIRSMGYNLAGDASCNLTQPNDISNGIANLQPLAVTAPGKTPTHALGSSSQALDRIAYGVMNCGISPKDDQRGVTRPQGIRCDSGAFESDKPPLSCTPPFFAGTDDTLNEAILCANNAGAGDHTINITANITLNAPLALINNPAANRIRLNGAGFTINGNNAGTILNIAAGTVAEVSNITITGGSGNNGRNSDSGGGVYNRGDLTLTNSTIIGNNGFAGAGIFNAGGRNRTAELTLVNTTVTNNQATDTGGGIANDGNEGEALVVLIQSIVSNNTANEYGGGLSNNGNASQGTITIENSTITGNIGKFGAGIFNNGNSGTANLTIVGSSIYGNSGEGSGSAGGGVFNNGNRGTATVSITNSTISGNNAGIGDGLANSGNEGSANLALNFVTIATNGSGDGNAIYSSSGASVTARNSIISAAASGSACLASGGAIQSSGYNMISDNSCAFNEPGDLSNTNPGLLPLAANPPGNTQTHALTTDSPALARVPVGTNGCGTIITTDQRGAVRPTPGESCDVGAFEYSANILPPLDFELFLPVSIGG